MAYLYPLGGVWDIKCCVQEAYCEESVGLQSVKGSTLKIVTRKIEKIKSDGSIKLTKLIGSV